MKDDNKINDLRRKIFVSYHKDGAVDILFGVCAFGFGMAMAFQAWWVLPLCSMAGVIYFFIKQYITTPRFGYVDFGIKAAMSRRLALAAGIGVFVFFLVLGLGRFSDIFPREITQSFTGRYHMVFISGLVFGMPCGILFFFLVAKRFLVYGVLTVLLPFFGAYLSLDTYIPQLILGGIILLYGVILMAVFLLKYPLSREK